METIRQLGDLSIVEKSFEAGERLGEHLHANGSLTLVTRGTLVEEFEDGTLCCEPWRLHYKPPSIPHATVAGPHGLSMIIVSHVDPIPSRYRTLQGANPCLLDGGALAALALTLLQAVHLPSDSAATAKSCADRVLAAFCERFERPHQEPAPCWLADAGERVRTLAPHSDSLARLATEFGFHPVYLARRFRRHFGCSVGRMIRRSRIDEAVRRLIDTDMPLTDLALELGYYDQSHFSRDFQRETAWSPMRFRREARRLA